MKNANSSSPPLANWCTKIVHGWPSHDDAQRDQAEPAARNTHAMSQRRARCVTRPPSTTNQPASARSLPHCPGDTQVPGSSDERDDHAEVRRVEEVLAVDAQHELRRDRERRGERMDPQRVGAQQERKAEAVMSADSSPVLEPQRVGATAAASTSPAANASAICRGSSAKSRTSTPT